MPETAQDALIEQYGRELRIPALRREYPALVRRATDGGWGYQHFLTHLLDVEVEGRRQGAAARALREARFPEVKTLEQLEWSALRGIQPAQARVLNGKAHASFSPVDRMRSPEGQRAK
jgi:DNA replication protein DnaC